MRIRKAARGCGREPFRPWMCPTGGTSVLIHPRARSFAFKVNSPFSVNVASMIGLEGAVRHMNEVLHCPNGGIVSFNCGRARSVGFDARHELDPQYPENNAHANVSYRGSSGRRKRDAKALAEMCVTVHKPRF